MKMGRLDYESNYPKQRFFRKKRLLFGGLWVRMGLPSAGRQRMAPPHKKVEGIFEGFGRGWGAVLDSGV